MKNTHTIVPYLTIILEVLENFIATYDGDDEDEDSDVGFSGSLMDRDVVEAFVYGYLYSQENLNSFRQPFHLPLAELQIYLNHFPTSRAEVARIVLAYQDDPDEIIPQAELQLSQREYDVIREPNASSAFLSNLYPFLGTTPESRELLQAMGVSREELTTLVKTDFIGPNGIIFEEERTEGSIQFNREVVKGLSLERLDRMHRFVRLWRQVDWSIDELDAVLQHIYDAEGATIAGRNDLPLAAVSQLQSLQRRLRVSVPELCALFHRIPSEGSSSFFDSLFNLPVFVRRVGMDGDRDRWPTSEDTFPFPYPTGPDDSETAQQLHRLLAGLGLNDDELFQLDCHSA